VRLLWIDEAARIHAARPLHLPVRDLLGCVADRQDTP